MLIAHCVIVLYLNKDDMYTLTVQCVTHHVLYNLLMHYKFWFHHFSVSYSMHAYTVSLSNYNA